MYPKVDDTPIPKQALRFYNLVFDAVYTPKVTRLLSKAQEASWCHHCQWCRDVCTPSNASV
ncbi:bifunctional 3-dehydroquinate dehydratase/shikimate dehydrogenase [Carex littledalei]|uniref:Bifunctional 3-dehydroquinate dehydratase/shikimate dehydrogenase n=1 Tax=Carex littledalei TaxID=544730 RepID=A0A833QHB7_9POAL|nr:bifunctional 3-dehydroquinate dehydratase/shikimate dehydrogenase [Carex littledalei]